MRQRSVCLSATTASLPLILPDSVCRQTDKKHTNRLLNCGVCLRHRSHTDTATGDSGHRQTDTDTDWLACWLACWLAYYCRDVIVKVINCPRHLVLSLTHASLQTTTVGEMILWHERESKSEGAIEKAMHQHQQQQQQQKQHNNQLLTAAYRLSASGNGSKRSSSTSNRSTRPCQTTVH